MQHLLITVCRVFPALNHKVEEHTYFSKWKAFDKEAFSDMGNDELKPLLYRGMYLFRSLFIESPRISVLTFYFLWINYCRRHYLSCKEG